MAGNSLMATLMALSEPAAGWAANVKSTPLVSQRGPKLRIKRSVQRLGISRRDSSAPNMISDRAVLRKDSFEYDADDPNGNGPAPSRAAQRSRDALPELAGAISEPVRATSSVRDLETAAGQPAGSPDVDLQGRRNQSVIARRAIEPRRRPGQPRPPCRCARALRQRARDHAGGRRDAVQSRRGALATRSRRRGAGELRQGRCHQARPRQRAVQPRRYARRLAAV